MEFVKKHWVAFAIGGGFVLAYFVFGRGGSVVAGGFVQPSVVPPPPATGPSVEAKTGRQHF